MVNLHYYLAMHALRQKDIKIQIQPTQPRINNIQLQLNGKNRKVHTRYHLDKIESFNKFDIKGIIRLQLLQQKQKQLKTTYKARSYTKKYSTSRNNNTKFDMIIPSFQAFNINSDQLLGFSQEALQKINRPKTQSKNFRNLNKKNSVTDSFNISAKIIDIQTPNNETSTQFKLFSKKSQQLSKQYYSQLHGRNQNMSEIKFRSKNVENIIRRKIGSSFHQGIQEYLRRMKIDQKSHIFIFQSSDTWMKEALLQKGWILNPDPTSKIFHLKWTNKISIQKGNKNQLINHFYDSDLLTSKEGLAKVVKRSRILSKNSPRSFDLGVELNEFIMNFNQTQILCGLKKIVKEIIKNNLNPHQIIQTHNLKNSLNQLKKEQKYEQQVGKQPKYLILHIPYAIQLCAFCQNLRCDVEEQQRQQYNHLNQKSLKNLFNFSLLNPPYNQYISNTNPATQNRSSSPIRFNIHNINMYSSQYSFKNASNSLIKILYSYHKYFCQNLNTYEVQGQHNIWITKNRNSSKGTGISLSNNLHQILKKVQNKLVQKYIEDCALYKTINGQFKYDLRVWVLVTSFNPLISYFYEQFYCRLCSQPYSLENLNLQQSHLTNYSMNRQSFINDPSKKSSILTYPQFLQIASTNLNKSNQQSRQFINKRLNNIIYHTLLPYTNLIRSEPQCFQLYGFDLLVTNNMNMHLLEVNLSPACQVRNQWLGQQVKNMSHGILSIIQQKQQLQKIRKNGWKFISQQFQ